MDLQGLPETTINPDFPRHVIGLTARRLMERDVEGLAAAARERLIGIMSSRAQDGARRRVRGPLSSITSQHRPECCSGTANSLVGTNGSLATNSKI
jgi:hypothetical protein